MTRCLLLHMILGLLPGTDLIRNSCSGQESREKPERVYVEKPATWYEDAWKKALVSRDGKWALYGTVRGVKLVELNSGRGEPERLIHGLDAVSNAVLYKGDKLARLGRRGKESGWFLPGTGELKLSSLPADAVPTWSPDGLQVAWYHALEPAKGLFVDFSHDQKPFELGGRVSGLAWSADGSVIYAMVWATDGASSLARIHPTSGKVETIARDLDAARSSNSLGLSPDGKHIYLALASAGPPHNEERHQPHARRSLSIYDLDLASGAMRPKIQGLSDDFGPTVAGEYLYWTHNDIRASIVVLPAIGGEARQVVEAGQLPRWERPGGTRLAFFYGGWRLADWALNLDAGIVDVDPNGQPTSPPRPFVSGYHEDFTPDWSPDGKWMVYHSHRSRQPVPSYGSEGSADDLFLRRAGDPPGAEVRLTDFGWEVGPADWSPDGSKLVFCSWEKGGTPGLSRPWVLTIDTDSGKVVRTERFPLPKPLEGAEEVSWSPDGEAVLIEENTGEDRRALWLVGIDGKSARKLVDYRSGTYGGIAWAPDGKTIVYAGLAANRMQLFAIPRLGGDPRQLTDDAANLMHPCVSPNGRWIACTRSVQSKEIWRVKLSAP
jgi:Tol biopolymer transport system component